MEKVPQVPSGSDERHAPNDQLARSSFYRYAGRLKLGRALKNHHQVDHGKPPAEALAIDLMTFYLDFQDLPRQRRAFYPQRWKKLVAGCRDKVDGAVIGLRSNGGGHRDARLTG